MLRPLRYRLPVFFRRRVAATFCRYNSIIGNLFPTCITCGIKLQSSDANAPGYFFKRLTATPQETQNAVKSSDKAYSKLVANISQEDLSLLLNDNEHSGVTKQVLLLAKTAMKQSATRDVESSETSCKRCRDAIYREAFNLDEHPVESVESVLSKLDPLGNIVHLVNAFDFPLTLKPSLFRLRKVQDIKVVITKADRLFVHSKSANNYGLKFFRDYLYRKYGIQPENVFITSGAVDWNIKELLKNLPDNSYFVGDVNVGKSTLIKSMLYGDEKFSPKKSFVPKKERTELEKRQDYLINAEDANETIGKKTFSQKKLERKYEESFKAKNGPGVSHMPAFTRGVIRLELPNFNKTIFDVPGFGEENHGIYHWIEDAKTIKHVTKGTKVPKRGSYDSHYFTVKSGKCLTIGGLFYLNVPLQLMVQIRNCINEDEMVLRDFEKAKSVVAERKPTLAKKIVVSCESTHNLVKYVIPPFYGAVDLVVKNVGHINIKPVGKLDEDAEPFIVYLPKGVEAVVRKPIMKYIQKSIVGRDKRGNPLAKENWVTKGIKAVEPYTGGVFYSKLIPIPDDISDVKSFTKAFSENMNGIKIDETNLEPESILSKYWIEL